MTMKADEFRPNASQANYFKGFWRITSKINAKIQVRKVISVTQPFFLKNQKPRKEFVAGFAKNDHES